MKKKNSIIISVIVMLVIMMVIFVTGCGSDDTEQEPTTEATTATTTEATTAAPKDNDILKSKLQALIDELGRGTSSGTGVAFAKMVDMDGDGTREMIVIHDMKAEVFQVKDGKAESVFEGTIGIQYGQTDTGYEVMINESISPVTLVLFNSSDEWVDENITAVTMADGAIQEKHLKAATTGDNDTPAREELVTFSIDGASVSGADYENEYTKLTEGADVVNPMTPSDLDEILASMK